MLERISPFYRNARKEITKAPVVYFEDLGFRNYAAGVFGRVEEGSILGFLFENLTLFLLKEKISLTPDKIHFWRTKDGAEVDFLIDDSGQTPFEIKYQSLKKAEMTRSFRNYIEKYKPKEAFIINLTLSITVTLDDTIVHYLPINKFIGYKL